MKRYVKTSWFYWFFEEDRSSKHSDSRKWKNSIWAYNYWKVNRGSLEEGLNELSKLCNEKLYEIKGIIPIDRAQSYEYGQADSWVNLNNGGGWGLGQGWGISMTDGFAAILQRIEILDDEEYERRIKTNELKRQKTQCIESIGKAEDNIKSLEEEIKNIKTLIDNGIVEMKKGVFAKKLVYKVGDNEFPDKIEAEVYIDNDLRKNIADKRNKISSLLNKIDEYNGKIKDIDNQIYKLNN